MTIWERLQGVRQWLNSTRAGQVTLTVITVIVAVPVMIIGAVVASFIPLGWAIVLAGLAMLATRFVWARRLSRASRDLSKRRRLGQLHEQPRIATLRLLLAVPGGFA